MSDDAYQRKAAAFAAMLVKQAAWPAAIVMAGGSIGPLVASARSALHAPLAVLALLVAAAARWWCSGSRCFSPSMRCCSG